MAGTISLSLSQQFDELGKPLSGGKLYFIQAGTTSTPQNAFYDPDLTLPLPNPVTLDAAGRVPAFYLADGQIKVRLTNADGVPQVEQDNLLVVGPSSGGGGGGGGVDPTTVLQTGAVQAYYGTGTRSGYVRANGRTIGSATSGATERANSDAQALFEFLWAADSNLAVSAGRGVSAAADWTANKTIALPDARNRVMAGLGDMGNSDAGLFSGLTFSSGNGTTLGSALAGTVTLTTPNLPAHAHNVYLNDPGHDHKLPTNLARYGTGNGGSGGPAVPPDTNARTDSNVTGLTIWSAAGGTGTQNSTAQTGSSTPFKTAQPTILMTFYLKL